MKNLKRILAFILIASMIFAVVGCKSDKQVDSDDKDGDVVEDSKKDDDNKEVEEDKDGDDEQEGDEIDKYKPIDGKEYKITWTAGRAGPVDDDAELIRHFNEKFNVDIDAWNIDVSQWDEVLNLKFASKEIPDKLQIRGFVNLQKYYDQDFMADLPEEVLQELAPNVYNAISTDIPGALKYGKIDGNLYAIPTYNGDTRFRHPVVWRGDWLKNVGIEKTPETLKEFEEAFYKFVKEDPNKSGKADTYALSGSGLNSIYGAFGYIPGFWAVKDGKLVFGGVQPEMKEALALLNKWYKDGLIDPEFITGENKGGYAGISHAFADGKIGYTNHGIYYHWKAREETDNNVVGSNVQELGNTSPEAIDKLIFGQPPIGPEGHSGVNQGNIITGVFEGFGKQLAEEPDKMGKILEIFDYTMASFENYMEARLGLHGKHWEMKNGIPTPIGIYEDVKEITKMGGMVNFNIMQPYEFAEQLAPHIVKWAREHGFDQNGIRNQLLSTLPSQGRYQAELDKVFEESYVSIIVGDKPVDYFDEFVEMWNKAGGEVLTKEANEWYSNIVD